MRRSLVFIIILLFSVRIVVAEVVIYNNSLKSKVVSWYMPSAKKERFMGLILPKIERVNAEVSASRNKALHLYLRWEKTNALSRVDLDWLGHLAHFYRIKTFNYKLKSNWGRLLKRVDVVPVSLVLAQAINESAWGQSRFAKKGNNYFGRWCHSKGCGIVPNQRPVGATYEVKKYPSALASVRDYLHNLDTNLHYKKLRNLRLLQRQNHIPLDSMVLAEGLIDYSELGLKYVSIIQNLIQHFNLQVFDLPR